MIFTCVLKRGGIYNAAHVERLRSMIPHPVICLTDDPAVIQPTIPLTNNWPGWWSKLELFKLEGHLVYFDLDVTIQRIDWLDGLDKAGFHAMADAWQPGGCPINSSVMMWQGPRLDLIADFKSDFAHHAGGDQDWIWRHLGGQFNLISHPDVVSYKKHGPLPDAGVISYHGKIKPWASSTNSLYNILAPGAKIDGTSKYKEAWKCLGNESAGLSDRHNAKCWLTYRAIDGEITLADWITHIQGMVAYYPQTPLGVRWQVSQMTAEVYLFILNGNLHEARSRIAAVNDTVYSGGSDLWPPCVLNWIRCAVLNQYALFLEGFKIDDSAARIVEIWRGIAHKYDWNEWPMRVDEMIHDIRALNVLAAISHKRESAPWLTPKNLVGNKEIFHRCLIKLGEGNPNALFK